MNDNTPKIAALIPVGPRPGEVDRLEDTLDSLVHYESGVAYVVIVDDSNGSNKYENILDRYFPTKIIILDNPRQGKGMGWSGGLCVAVSTGLKWIMENTNVDFTVRLDTDSLVISSFSNRTIYKIKCFPNHGLLGTFSYYPDGSPRSFHPLNEWIIRKLRRPLAIWRHSEVQTLFQFGFFGRSKVIRNIISKAVSNGYIIGTFCQGGGYIITPALTTALRSNKLLDDVLLFRNRLISEDYMMTMACYASGLTVGDFNLPGDPIEVTSGTYAYSLEDAVKKDRSIIHSIKSDDNVKEEDIRTFFRNLRNKTSGITPF